MQPRAYSFAGTCNSYFPANQLLLWSHVVQKSTTWREPVCKFSEEDVQGPFFLLSFDLTHQSILVPRDEGDWPREVGDLARYLDSRAVLHVQLAHAAQQGHRGLWERMNQP